MTVITVPNILREKLGESAAQALAELISKATDEHIDHRIEESKSSLQLEIEKIRTEIARTKSEIVRWMFVFIMGQFWAIVGTLFVFFRK